MDESSSGRNVSSAEPAADNDQDSDLATILQFLIRRYSASAAAWVCSWYKIYFIFSGQIHIITAEHEDAESESYENIISPPRINYQPNTSVLDVSAV